MADEKKVLYKSCKTCTDFESCPIKNDTITYVKNISALGYFPNHPNSAKPESKMIDHLHDILGEKCWMWK